MKVRFDYSKAKEFIDEKALEAMKKRAEAAKKGEALSDVKALQYCSMAAARDRISGDGSIFRSITTRKSSPGSRRLLQRSVRIPTCCS